MAVVLCETDICEQSEVAATHVAKSEGLDNRACCSACAKTFKDGGFTFKGTNLVRRVYDVKRKGQMKTKRAVLNG
jgi:hypothetical protein